MTAWLCALCGAAAGIAQVRLLARAARRARPSPLSAALRLALVAAVLVLAARAGNLVPGAVGWAAGFAPAVAVGARRRA